MAKRENSGSIVPFSHRRKAEVEELLTIDSRLKEVEDALAKFIELVENRQRGPQDADPSNLYARSLYCFAAVTYSRCFSSGCRQRLKLDDILTLTDRDREFHEAVRHLRNQHFAHAVTDKYEGTQVFLHIKPSEQEPSGFVTAYAVLTGADSTTVHRFLTLIRKVRVYLSERTATAGDEMAKAMFGETATWRQCAGVEKHA